jgi:hypothetical protein
MSNLYGYFVESGKEPNFGSSSSLLQFDSSGPGPAGFGLTRALPFLGLGTSVIFDKSRDAVTKVKTATLQGVIIFKQAQMVDGAGRQASSQIVSDFIAMQDAATAGKKFDLVVTDAGSELIRYEGVKLISIDLEPGRMYSYGSYKITVELTEYAGDNLGVFNLNFDLSWTGYFHIGEDGYIGDEIARLDYSADGDSGDYEKAMNAMAGKEAGNMFLLGDSLLGHEGTGPYSAGALEITRLEGEDSSTSSVTEARAGRSTAGWLFLPGYVPGLGVKYDFQTSIDPQSIPQVETSWEFFDATRASRAISFWTANIKPNLFSRAGSFVQTVNENLVIENQQPNSISVDESPDGYVTNIQASYATGERYKFKNATHEVIDVVDKPGRPTYAIFPVLGKTNGPVLQSTSGRTEYVRELNIECSFAAGVRPSKDEIDSVVGEYRPQGNPVFQGDITEVFGEDEGRFTFSTSWIYTENSEG